MGRASGPPGYDRASYGEVSGNTIYSISGIKNAGEGDSYDADGLYCDGCEYLVFERNLVHNCDLNIEVASEHGGLTAAMSLSAAMFFTPELGGHFDWRLRQLHGRRRAAATM